MTYLRIYHHRHGEDLTTHTTEESAFVGACFTIIEHWDEIDDADVRREIKQHLIAGEYAEAVSTWSDYQMNGGLEEELVVCALVDPITCLGVDLDLINSLKEDV